MNNIPYIILAIAFVLALYFRFDRKRYRGQSAAGQKPTGEVFRDPTTGKLMRVYEDPATGKREYREQ